MIRFSQDIPEGTTEALETFNQLSPLMAIMLVVVLIVVVILLFVVFRGRADNTDANTINKLAEALTSSASASATANAATAQHMGKIAASLEVTTETFKTTSAQLAVLTTESKTTLEASISAAGYARASHEVTRILPGTITTAIATAIRPILTQVENLNEQVGILKEAVEKCAALDPALLTETRVILEQSKLFYESTKQFMLNPPISAEMVKRVEEQEKELQEESSDP